MRQVHEYTIDRATSTARLGGTNPIRKYIRGAVDEKPPVIVQLSRGEINFFDQGGQQMDISDVPQEILDDLKRAPLRRGNESVEQVLKFCPLCPTTDNTIASNEYEAHLIHHAKQASIVTPVEVVDEPAKKVKKAKV